MLTYLFGNSCTSYPYPYMVIIKHFLHITTYRYHSCIYMAPWITLNTFISIKNTLVSIRCMFYFRWQLSLSLSLSLSLYPPPSPSPSFHAWFKDVQTVVTFTNCISTFTGVLCIFIIDVHYPPVPDGEASAGLLRCHDPLWANQCALCQPRHDAAWDVQ